MNDRDASSVQRDIHVLEVRESLAALLHNLQAELLATTFLIFFRGNEVPIRRVYDGLGITRARKQLFCLSLVVVKWLDHI